MADLRTDDADIDALLGAAITRAGGEAVAPPPPDELAPRRKARPQAPLYAHKAEVDKRAASPDADPIVQDISAALNAQLAEAAAQAPLDPRTLPVRFHRLKQFSLSAAHYHQVVQHERVDVHATLALRMGAGVHAGLFEDKPLVCYPARRQGKAWERFRRHHTERGAVILTAPEYSRAMGIIGSVRRHPRAMQLLFDGTRIEETFTFDFLGRECRATPDAFTVADPFAGRNCDLKSTRTAEPRAFARDAIKRAYHAQLEFYAEAIEAHTGTRPREDYLIAVENVAPYCVVVWRIPDATRVAAAKLVRQWFEQLVVAETSGFYPGYVEGDLDLELPEYMSPEHSEPLQLEHNGELITVE